MYVTHADLPPEQWQPGVGLDSYQTGVGLTYWFSDAPTVTSEMQTALQIFWGSTDVLTAALAQGVSNIWNNAALIAYIQKHY
jgi:hypothetical protein